MADDSEIDARSSTFPATPKQGEVSALLLRPAGARWLLVFAHGAGAGMRHRFMAAMSAALAERGIATFRYQFPYMEAGGRRPDPGPRCSPRCALRSRPRRPRHPICHCSRAASRWAAG